MLKTTSAPARHIRCGANFLAYTQSCPSDLKRPAARYHSCPAPDRELRAAGLFNAHLDVIRPNRVTFVGGRKPEDVEKLRRKLSFVDSDPSWIETSLSNAPLVSQFAGVVYRKGNAHPDGGIPSWSRASTLDTPARSLY